MSNTWQRSDFWTVKKIARDQEKITLFFQILWSRLKLDEAIRVDINFPQHGFMDIPQMLTPGLVQVAF